MKKLINVYDQVEEKLLVGSLMFSTALIFFQVIMRSVFNSSLSWSEELSRYIFIWQIWLGTSIALRMDKHINVELILDIFKKSKRAQEIIRLIGLLFWMAFSIFLVCNGFELLGSMIKRNALSSGMRMPLSFVYLSLPVSSIVVCLRLIGNIKRAVKKIINPEEAEA